MGLLSGKQVVLKKGDLFITARRRGLGQRNVFTGVCLSTEEGVCRQRISASKKGLHMGEGSAYNEVCIQGVWRGSEGGWADPLGLHQGGGGGQTLSGTTKAGDTHPTGMLSCLIWMSSIVSNTNNVSHDIALVCVKGKTPGNKNSQKLLRPSVYPK